MARVEDEGLASRREASAEFAQRRRDLFYGEVLALDHLEAELAQPLRHRARVVRGIHERGGGVVAVADHERHAVLRARAEGEGCREDACEERLEIRHDFSPCGFSTLRYRQRQ